VMLERVRKEMGTNWGELLPWRQLSVIGAASLLACAPALVIARVASEGPRPFLALCAAGLAYCLVYLAAIAMVPGEGSAAARVRRILLGHVPAPAV
jgi:hypothetical protein